MTNPTLTSINELFMLHRPGCRLCASPGGGVCAIGLELLRLYSIAVNGDTPEAYRRRVNDAMFGAKRIA